MKKITKPQLKEVQEVLNKIGLNDRDIKVYLQILIFKSSSLTPLSIALDMPHSTVQSVLQRLYEQGLIDVSKNKGRKIYQSLKPSVLKKVLQYRMEEVNNIIPHLNNLTTEDGGHAKIKVYYRQRMADIFHQALECKNKKIYEIVSAGELQKILGEKFHFTKRRIHRGVTLKSLRIEADEIKKYNQKSNDRELRQAKYLPHELDFKASILLWDDTVAFFSTKHEGLAWVVRSRIIFDTQRQLFDLLWQLSRKIS